MHSKASRYLNHSTTSTYYTTRRTRLLLEKKLDSVRSSTNASSNSPPLVNEEEKEEESSCQLEVSTVMEQQSVQQKGIGSPVSPMLCSFPLEALGYSSPSCKDIITTTSIANTQGNATGDIKASLSSTSPPIGSTLSPSAPMNQSSSHIVSTAADTINPCAPTGPDSSSAVGHSYTSRQSTNTLNTGAGHSSVAQFTSTHSQPPVQAFTHPPSSVPTRTTSIHTRILPLAMHSTTPLSSTNSIAANVSHSSLHDPPKYCIPPNTLAYQEQVNAISCSSTNSLQCSAPSLSPFIKTEESCITGTSTSSLQSALTKDSQSVASTISDSAKDASFVQEALQDEDDIR